MIAWVQVPPVAYAPSIPCAPGAGVEDWGNFGVMPVRGQPTGITVSNDWYHSPFDKASEAAAPGYYTATLTGTNTTAEMTAAGTHAAMHRWACVNVYVCHSLWGVRVCASVFVRAYA